MAKQITRNITFTEVASRTFTTGQSGPVENEIIIFTGKTTTKKILREIKKMYEKKSTQTAVITAISEKSEKRSISLDDFIKYSKKVED